MKKNVTCKIITCLYFVLLKMCNKRVLQFLVITYNRYTEPTSLTIISFVNNTTTINGLNDTLNTFFVPPSQSMNIIKLQKLN